MFEIQFAAILLMSLLTLTLCALMPHRATHDTVVNHSRWMMMGGTVLLAIQFLLQYLLRLREMGITQAVICNLLLFIPSAWMFCLSVLNLQRQGYIRRIEWMLGAVAWVSAAVLIAGAWLYGHRPLLANSREMKIAEILSGIIYAIMQFHYTFIQMRELNRMRRTLEGYYDRTRDNLLGWMGRSIIIMTIMAAMAPLLIFTSGLPLVIYALFCFFGIYYLVISFVCYVVSNASQQMREAEQSETENEAEINCCKEQVPMQADNLRHIQTVVEQWLARGGHLHSGITIQTAAAEIGIPRYLLSAWLKTTPQELFSPWLTQLRLEEAQQLMRKHPDWSNDAIAQACGFGSRTYFQHVFHKHTGMTPTQFLKKIEIASPMIQI